MKEEFRESFARAVHKWFGDLAVGLNLRLLQLADGVFAIDSPYFSLRIRASSGHSSDLLDLLVTLVPVQQRFAKFGSGKGEIGLGVIMEYSGDHLLGGSPISKGGGCRPRGQTVSAANSKILCSVSPWNVC